LLVAGGALSIGFAPIGLRLGLETLGPQAIAFWRYVFGVPMTFALVILVHRRLPVRPNKFVFMAGTFFALDIALWHWALTYTTVANSTFIVSLGNLSVGLLALIFLKEKLTSNWAIAVVIALIGAALLTQGGGVEALGDVRGDGLAVGAAILVSFYMLCAKIARRDIGGLDVLFWVTLTEMIVAGFVTLVSGETFIPANISGWRAPFMLAIIVQCLGQGLIIAGLGRTPAAIAGILMLIQPVAAAAVSWRLFEEPLLALQILGAGLILVGVGLSQTGKLPKKVS
jgi:drug/metabolite transporter (DMT)-like permease